MQRRPVDRKKNHRIALVALGIVGGMIGLTYASVPLYQMFCEVTGFGGTIRKATAAPETTLDKYITVRFDANLAGTLGWRFVPAQTTMRVKLGEPNEAIYRATNLLQTASSGTATYNVTPNEAGVFFNKIQCFCFTNQTLAAGQTLDMPVQFFVDPAILEDPDTQSIQEITLSYTFYPTPGTVGLAPRPAGPEQPRLN